MYAERYFFCHLAKAGGVSVLTSLRKQFGEDAVYPLPEHEGNYEAGWNPEYLVDFMHERGDEIRVVSGHFPLCTRELFDFPVRTITILRDPVERTLSHLRYLPLVDPKYQDLSMEEAYAVPENYLGNLHKYMVKMLSMPVEEMTAGALSITDPHEGDLERAMANLESIDVVGVLDRYDLFHETLESTFGWDLGPPLHTNSTAPREVEPAFAGLIADDSAMDLELYRHAHVIVEQRASGQPRVSTPTHAEGAETARTGGLWARLRPRRAGKRS